MNRADYLRQPFEVSIETLALCNARCTFCPYPTLDRKGVRMSDELIDRLLVEMGQFKQPFFFSPFKVNEPFLDKRLLYICDSFERMCPQGKLRLFTNGSMLNVLNISLIKALTRVEHLWISLNSHDPVSYERIMGLNFYRVTAKLDVLHETDKFPHPMIISKVSDDDYRKNDDFVIYVGQRWPKFIPVVIKRDGWLGYVEPSDPRVPHRNCSRWFELSVMATGKVALCCMDGTGEHAIGNVNSQTLLDVYNSPGWLSHRSKFAVRQHYSPCNRCTY